MVRIRNITYTAQRTNYRHIQMPTKVEDVQKRMDIRVVLILTRIISILGGKVEEQQLTHTKPEKKQPHITTINGAIGAILILPKLPTEKLRHPCIIGI